jgi:hypothetical protein
MITIFSMRTFDVVVPSNEPLLARDVIPRYPEPF